MDARHNESPVFSDLSHALAAHAETSAANDVSKRAVREAPLDVLVDLVALEASGELVSVSSGLEVHVYLQAGRVAWATDSTAPYVFVRHLLEHTALTRETLAEVLATCRRGQLPLGQTLLAHKVVTLDELREAIGEQIRGAFAALEGSAGESHGRTIFLSRQRELASYDARLTFAAHDLVPRGPRSVPPGRTDRSTTPLLDHVRDALEGAAWLEALDEHEVVEQLPAGGPFPSRVLSRVPALVAERTVLDGADHLALRTAHGTLLGAALGGGRRSLWCRLRPDHAFGFALATLCRMAGIERLSTPAPGPLHPGRKIPVPHSWGVDQRPAVIGEMHALMERAAEIRGVVLAVDGEPVCGALRDRVDATRMSNLVRRRAPVLDISLPADPHVLGSVLEELGGARPSMVTGEAELWCFGARLGDEQTLWIFTDRDSAQGLGWAYLTSLSRELSLASESALAAGLAGDGGTV